MLSISFSLSIAMTSQVELAHGGRGPSSFDRSSSYSSAGRRGASKRTDYRGLYFSLPSFKDLIERSPCSYWIPSLIMQL